MASLKQIYAREILDSRGDPTIEVVAMLDDGSVGVASDPSGASTGTYEAHELKDQDPTRYLGKGMIKSATNVNGEIAQLLTGQPVDDFSSVDEKLIKLDGTPNKSRLGADAILCTSVAIVKALASSQKLSVYRFIANATGTSQISIPIPVFNMINGGKHGAGNLDFQEFFIIPTLGHTFSSSLEKCTVIYHTIKKILARRGAIHSVGDEGGFAPNLFTNLDALEVLSEAVIETSHKLGVDVELGLDVAANSFYKDGRYIIKDRSSPMDAVEFIDYLKDLNKQYHLRILEDPLFEDDWHNWTSLTSDLGTATYIVGDDLIVTNIDRTNKAISEKACNAILIKPNQIGTVTETMAVIKASKSAGWKVIVSHRSGETNDPFIADFAVGVGADYVKFGAPARGERVAKYNRLLSIESELTQPPI